MTLEIWGTRACAAQSSHNAFFQDDLGQKPANMKEGKSVGVTIKQVLLFTRVSIGEGLMSQLA